MAHPPDPARGGGAASPAGPLEPPAAAVVGAAPAAPPSTLRIVTHSGPFHADEVFAFALLRVCLEQPLELLRTRDAASVAAADIAIDVGGKYDPERGRFDHHQRSYRGPLSSAGMVLRWLERSGKLSSALAAQLRHDWVDYIDAVDNGRRQPAAGVPCLPTVVAALAEQADSPAELDAAFLDAVAVCEGVVRGLRAAERRHREASAAVVAAMRRAEAAGSRILSLDRHYQWKRAYFENGGAHHPTDYVLYPDPEGTWRLLGIPKEGAPLGLARPLPSEWAGLADEDLVRAVGAPGAIFCHKNRFVAVFASEAAARAAITRWNLDTGGAGPG